MEELAVGDGCEMGRGGGSMDSVVVAGGGPRKAGLAGRPCIILGIILSQR